jgi:DNA-binding transcriptional MerR regulator
MIRAAQKVGLSIEEINDALSTLTPRQAPTPEDWERLAQRLRDVVTQRIDELFAILNELGPGADIDVPRSRANPSARTTSVTGLTSTVATEPGMHGPSRVRV